jgi:uncharacterized protein YbcV (DUF1398 family)
MAALIDEKNSEKALSELDQVEDAGSRLMLAWLAASERNFVLAEKALKQAEAGPLSHHHQLLALALAGELAWEADNKAQARQYWQQALSLLTADSLDLPLTKTLQKRLEATKGPAHFYPPDLKFQDILEYVL